MDRNLAVLCPKSKQPVVDRGTYFFFKGYPGIYFHKTMYQRPMTVDEYLAVINGESPKFDGFISQKNKPFSAKLVLKELERKVALLFEDEGPGTPLDCLCPLSKQPVQDKGSYFIFPGYPETRFYKLVAKRNTTAEEYAAALASEKPIFLEGFVSKAGAAFPAAFRFNPETKRMKLEFAPRAPGSRPNGSRPGARHSTRGAEPTEAVSADFKEY